MKIKTVVGWQLALPCGMQARREHQPRLGSDKGDEKLDGGEVAMARQTGETPDIGMDGGETCLTPRAGPCMGW